MRSMRERDWRIQSKVDMMQYKLQGQVGKKKTPKWFDLVGLLGTSCDIEFTRLQTK